MASQPQSPNDPVSDTEGRTLPPNLPDPFILENGKRVTTRAVWREKRRPELLELFRTHVYGHAPARRPRAASVTVESVVTPGMMDGRATRYEVALPIAGPRGRRTINLLLFVPSNPPRSCPAFLLICNRERSCIDPSRATQSPFWPAERLIERGYAAAAFQVDDVDPDRADGYPQGIRAIYPHAQRPDSWGAIGAWAWGASRVLDWLETFPAIDAKRVAVIGHSRGGKAALWCGAQDTRLALVISNNSGCTGAALARGKTGERIARINQSFPYWFCENYKAYGDRENDLPVDQHELLALITPRPLYVASATEDTWADPPSEFLSCIAASPVYRLLGKKGVGSERLPPPETPLQTGSIGYHLRTGAHDLTAYDWEQYLNFADRHLR